MWSSTTAARIPSEILHFFFFVSWWFKGWTENVFEFIFWIIFFFVFYFWFYICSFSVFSVHVFLFILHLKFWTEMRENCLFTEQKSKTIKFRFYSFLKNVERFSSRRWSFTILKIKTKRKIKLFFVYQICSMVHCFFFSSSLVEDWCCY